MSEQRQQDEAVLIDYCTGNCSAEEARAVQQRLENDEEFRRLHGDIQATAASIRMMPEPDAPQDLVERTLSRVRQHQQTQALLAREQLDRPAVFRPSFSMRELATVAAAIILMAVVFVPSLRELRRQSLQVQCRSNAGQIGYAINSYALSNDNVLPAADAAASQRWLVGPSEPAASNSSGLFKLVKQEYVNPEVFQCPACPAPADRGFVVQAGMTDFPAGRYISYSYQHTLGPGRAIRLDPKLENVADSMAIFADATPLFKNGRFIPARVNSNASDNHGGAGQNVLYLDGHVTWQDNARVGVHNDNIYLANGIIQYRGDEAPASETDSFLLPAYTGSR